MRRSQTRRSTRPALALIAALAAACSPNFEEPEVQLERISVGGIGLEGGRLDVHLRVTNPNRFALEASQLEYTLQFAEPAGRDSQEQEDWIHVADGRSDRDVRVGARESVVVEIPVRFEYRDLGGAMRALLARGTVDYRVSGRVRLESPVGRTLPFSKTGAVDIFD